VPGAKEKSYEGAVEKDHLGKKEKGTERESQSRPVRSWKNDMRQGSEVRKLK